MRTEPKLSPAIEPMPKKSPRLRSAPPSDDGSVSIFDVLVYAWIIAVAGVTGVAVGALVGSLFRLVFLP